METTLDTVIASLEKKLSDTRELIEGYDEAMDYAIEELKQSKSEGK
jgi:hypothetical protein